MQNSAATALRAAENRAIGPGPSFYTGNGRNASGGPNGKVKGKKKTWLVAIILSGLLFGGGAFLSSSNTLFPFMFSANGTTATNTQQIATQSALRRIFKGWLKGDQTTSATIPSSDIPEAFAGRLQNNNFDVSGSSVSWTDTINNTSTTVTADNFDDLFYNNPQFRDDFLSSNYNTSADFYDNGALAAYSDVGESRNVWHSYKQTGSAETDATAFNDTMRSSFDKNSAALRNYADGEKTREETYIGEDGEEHTRIVTYREVSDESGNVKPSSSTAVDKSTVASALTKLGTVGQATDYICAALQVGTMFTSMVAGLETYNAMRFALQTLENISKTQDGFGDAAALNAQMNNFSTNEVAEIPDYTKATADDVPENANVSGTMMEDPTVKFAISGAPANKAATKNYSLERLAIALGGTITMGAGAARTCAKAAITNNVVSLAAIGLSIGSGGIVSIGTYIVNKFLTLDTFKTVVIGFVIGLAIPAVARLMANFFDMTKGMSRGAVSIMGFFIADSNLLGKRVSAQTISSASEIGAFNREAQTVIALAAEVDRKNHSPFDITNGNTFLGSIAYSLYSLTFSSRLSKVTSLMRVASSSIASLTGRVSASGEGSSYITTYGDCPILESIGAKGDLFCSPITVSDADALSNIAYDDPTYVSKIMENMNVKTESYETGTGADTDALGQPYETGKGDGESTTYEIKEGSNLAKYISFCDGRESPYGITDYNILNADNIGNVVVNNIPVVGNVVSAFDSLNDIINDDEYDNFDWATGKTCGNTEENQEFWESEGKYYQTYVNSQRVYSQTGAFDDSENPVYAYQEKYNAEHPKDNSYAGFIARVSGLTTQDTETLLAIVDLYQFIDEYDASTRIAMDEGVITTFKSDQVVARLERGIYKAPETPVNDSAEMRAIARQYVIYADVRNRSYAVC